MIKHSYSHHQTGSSLVEALIVLPIFLIMVFGMMEMNFVFKAKNTLNLATQEAVRKGSFNNAKMASIEKALDQGMAPLYSLKKLCGGGSDTIKTATIAAGKTPGEICAQLIRKAINAQVSGGQGAAGTITIISPSEEIFKNFAVEMKIDANGNYGKGKTKAIPNDNLNWRKAAPEDLSVAGQAIKMNIQDANLLKIKTFWCQKLSVPGLDRLFYNTILRFNKSPEQHYCNQLSLMVGTGIAKAVYGKDQAYYIAIRSHAIARMQSPVFGDDLLTTAKLSKAIDSTTPVSTTPSAPVDSTGGTPGSPSTPVDCVAKPADPRCTTDPNGPKDSHGCYSDETFKTIQVIDGTSRKVNGGYCTKAKTDCSKDKNKDHKDCCTQSTTPSTTTTLLFKNNNKIAENKQLPLDYEKLHKLKRLI